MAVRLNSVLMFEVADAFGMVFKRNPKTDEIAADTSHTVHFGNVKVDFDLKLVSSLIADDCYMFMFRSMGNLALFAVARSKSKGDPLKIHVLNLAKMDSVDKWLEKAKPLDEANALALLGKAVVKTFQLKSKTWIDVSVAA